MPDTIVITRICIDLCSIKSAKTLSHARGQAMFLALRLRHPPDLTQCVEQRSTLDSGLLDTAPPKYELIKDPSGDVRAFGSPTALHCVRFASKRDYDEASTLLQKAKVRVFSTVHELAAEQHPRRTGSHTLCAHRLPNEHAPEGAPISFSCHLLHACAYTVDLKAFWFSRHLISLCLQGILRSFYGRCLRWTAAQTSDRISSRACSTRWRGC